MLGYCRTLGAEEICYLLLGKPDRFMTSINLHFKFYTLQITTKQLVTNCISI